MNYGLPYKGSKNRIANWVVDHLPDGDCLVDVFFGGGAVTHCALTRDKYSRYIINDLRKTPQFFLDAVAGKYADRHEWVSREEFHAKKDEDLWVAACYSFGNDFRTYAYGVDKEPYKRAAHLAVVDDDWSEFSRLCPEVVAQCRASLDGLTGYRERRIALGHAVVDALKKLAGDDPSQVKALGNAYYTERVQSAGWFPSKAVDRLACMERVQCLHALQRVQTLHALEHGARMERVSDCITAYNIDYRSLPLPDGAVVYCDPPYANSGEDYGGFDTSAFLNWAVEVAKTHPVIISEYNIDDDRFECIAEKEKQVTASAAAGCCKKIERLYRVKASCT